MKNFLLFFFISFALVFMNCSSTDSPSQVVKKFYNYAAEGKLNDAYNLISQSGKNMLDMWGVGSSAINDITEEIEKNNGIKNISIIKEDITGQMATVKYKIEYNNGKIKEDNEKLIKEKGKWKITVSK